MSADKLNVMLVVAHPDDAEVRAGGVSALFRKQGHRVKFLVMTNGDTGHHEMGGGALARRREKEALKSAAIIGAECDVLDIHNNELEPCLHYRNMLISEIRKFGADMIITHRLCDYHPDHRYTGQLARDAANSVHLPNVRPLTPVLKKKPVTFYTYDGFTRPTPFSADIVVDIGSVVGTKINMLHCHASQMYEWLAYESGELDKIPSSEDGRRKWLASKRLEGHIRIADMFRDRLVKLYGEETGGKVKYAEAFELSEYGAKLGEEDMKGYFPFF